MNNQNSKPIGYECQKAILHGFPLHIRRRLSQVCPAIRAAQRKVPYRFGALLLEKERTSFYTPNQDLRLHWSTLECEEFFGKLLNRYFKPGTVIRKLWIRRDRSALPNHSGVRVDQLNIDYCPNDLNFEKVNSFIDKRYPPKRISVEIDENSLESLNIPLFWNAGSLTVSLKEKVVDPITFSEKVMNFGNKNIFIQCTYFTLDSIYQVAKKWITTKQPIGTKIGFANNSDVAYSHLIKNFKRKFLHDGSPTFNAHESLLIPINEDVALMLFEVKDPLEFGMKFQMEIVKKEVPLC